MDFHSKVFSVLYIDFTLRIYTKGSRQKHTVHLSLHVRVVERTIEREEVCVCVYVVKGDDGTLMK